MNSISELRVEVDKVTKDIAALLPARPFSKKEVKVFEKLMKQWETLEPKIQEETLVLRARNKDTNETLVRYNAKYQVLVGQFKDLYESMKPHQSPRAIEIARDPQKAAFARFVKERIRGAAQGYPDLLGEKVTLKDIYKAYNRWTVTSKAKKMDSQELYHLCEQYFGDSRDKREYAHIRVFLDEEDVEEFDNTYDPVGIGGEIITKE